MVMKKLISSCIIIVVLLGSMASTAWAQSSRDSIFMDLSLSSQFYEPVYSLYLKEIYEGTYLDDALLIQPIKYVTRGDAAYMLYHLLGLTYIDGKNFSDVANSNEYYDAIETLSALRMIDGFTDGTFRPKDVLTRGQMSKIISIAFEYQISTNPTIPFTDVSETFKPYVDALTKQSVTKGISSTQFAPNRFITRQEMAAFLDRAYKKVPGLEYNKTEVIHVVNDLTRKVRMVTTQGLAKNFPDLDTKDISEDMKELAVDPYLTGALNNYTGIPCYACDVDINVRDFNFGFPYTIKKLSNTLIIVEAVAHDTYFYKGFRGTIELVRVGDIWKIKSLLKVSFEDQPLNLTIEEAIEYLKYGLPNYWNQNVKSIKHTGQHSVTGEALFLVNGTITYYFNLDTGYLDQYYK